MSSTIAATMSGTFLRPGVSKNKRLYTKENIGNAVRRMNESLKDPKGGPIVMSTSHANANKTLETVGRVTKVAQLPDGSATYEAVIANTQLGRDIAVLHAGDSPFAKGISIRGQWMSDNETVNYEGIMADTASDLNVFAIDFTPNPSVLGAEVTSTSILESVEFDASHEIFESFEPETFKLVEDFDEIVSEEDEAKRLVIQEAVENAVADILEDGKAPYGNVTYADPGYKADKKKRYPIESAGHVRAAWSYINMPKNHEGYTPAQVSSIKSKVKRAAKKFGINIAEEYKNLVQDIQDVVEAYVSMSIDNGAGTVSASGYTDDAGKLAAVATRVAATVISALNTLDPDADGDIDLAGGDSSSSKESIGEADTSTCLMCNNTLAEGDNYCAACGVPVPTATSDDNASTKTNKEGVDMTAENKTAEELAADKVAEDAAKAVAAQELNESIAKIVAEALAADRAAAVEEATKAKAELEEAEKVAADEAAAAVRETQIYSAEDMAAAVKEAALQVAATLKEEAVTEARANPTRKGQSGINVGALLGDDNILDESALVKLNPANFTKVAGQVWESQPALAGLFARANALSE